nr:RNA-dependent RNA polymerase [Flumine nodavirus 18]
MSLGLMSNGRAVTSVTLPLPLWISIRLRIARSKHPNISDVERHLRDQGFKKEAAVDSPPLYEIAMSSEGFPTPLITHCPGEVVPIEVSNTFQAIDGLVNEDGKEVGRFVCPSLCTNPDVVPNRSYNNDLASITGRVERVLNFLEPPPRYTTYAREFAKYVVPMAGLGSPLELQEIVEIQDRPTQRGRSAQVMHWICGVNPVSVKAFMKGESYGVANDPRNISTVGANHTLRLSAYTYAFKHDILYEKKWYAPAKPPREVAARVVDLAREYSAISESDYSRFDGTISLWLRENVERAIYLRWVAVGYARDLGDLLAAEINPRAMTSNGLAYEPEASRLSGSPLTTDGNTLINAFVSYAAGRVAGLDARKAWDLLGIYAGDDGLSPIKPVYLRTAAKDLGLALKCERRTEGHMAFLGRIFYEAASGHDGSVQDPLRTWRKLHISFAPKTISDRQALANRAAGYRSLDPNAPVLLEWCAKVYELTGLSGDVTTDAPHYAQMQKRDSAFGGWPQMTYNMGLAAISWRLGVSVDDVDRLTVRITNAMVMDDLYELWDNPPEVAKISAVVRGEIHYSPEEQGSSNTEPATRRRNAPRGPRPARNLPPGGRGRHRPKVNNL